MQNYTRDQDFPQADPIQRVLPHFEDARKVGNGWRARCPAHRSRTRSLAISEGRDRVLLIKCHGGCSVADVLHAVGLELRDLFPRVRGRVDELRRHAVDHRRFRRAPHAVVREMLVREVERVRERLRVEFGYDPPLRAEHLNAARQRVASVLGIRLSSITPFDWEGCAPMDTDEAWPVLYTRAVEEMRFAGRDPDHDVEARIAAEDLAAQWLHALAKEGA